MGNWIKRCEAYLNTCEENIMQQVILGNYVNLQNFQLTQVYWKSDFVSQLLLEHTNPHCKKVEIQSKILDITL